MRLVLRKRKPAWEIVYRLRPRFFAVSVVLHAALVALLLLIGPVLPTAENFSLYEREIQPHEAHIVWYPLKADLPELHATTKVGNSDTPQGNQPSPETIVAVSPEPTKSTQYIQHESTAEIKQQIQAPNLVAVERTQRSAAPVAEKKPVDLAAPPDLRASAQNAPTQALLAQQKSFVPPPVEKPKLPLPQRTDIDAPPSLANASNAAQNAKLPGTSDIKSLLHSSFVPPPGRPAVGNGMGPKPALDTPPNLAPNANMNAVVMSLNPSDRINAPIPEGHRPARFATGTGNISTGDASGTGFPDLAVRGHPGGHSGGEPSSATEKGKGVLYHDIITGAEPSTMSVPLRPDSRMIPPELEARFQNRLVYTLVIPEPHLPEYTGDWIMWFTEEKPAGTQTMEIHAPLPYQKKESVSAAAAATITPETRVQVAVVIDENGHLKPGSVLKGPAAIAATILKDLSAWQFTPATRNGKAIAVEVVLEVPFRLAVLGKE